jgi:hypothetical protein
MSRHLGDRTLGERTRAQEPEPLLTPVWVRDEGRHVPGVLLAWEKRGARWWGLIVWDAGRGREHTWLPAMRLAPIAPR